MIKYMATIILAGTIALQAQTVTDLTSKTGTVENLYGIYFINASTGWAVGANSKIIKTTDGGQTWTSQTPAIAGYGLRSVFFVNAMLGYVVTNAAPTSPEWASSWKTTDGGTSWSYDITFPVNTNNTGVYYTSAAKGIVSNDVYTEYYFNTGWISKLFSSNDVWFADANNGCICGGTSVMVTTDGNATWNTKTAGAISNCNFKSVYPISASTFICVGSNPNNSEKFFKTTDGGTTWNMKTNPTGASCLKVRFGNSTTGYAVGNSGAIARTTDAGDSWTSVNSGKSSVLYSVSCPPNSSVAYIAGAGGVILKISDAALPVELSSFTAAPSQGGILLNWRTATEMNNYGFEIERNVSSRTGTIDGGAEGEGTWIRIGFVEGSGTTNAPKSYSFADASASGRTSYRLKQIDRDGKFEYSKEVEVMAGGAPAVFALSQNYPNPFNPTTTITFAVPVTGRATLKILNTLGQDIATLFNREARSGIFNQVQFNASGLASGMYFSRLEYNGKIQMTKMTLIK
jgi:photosystem II stability/assembly factor-like uncharacterized protein